MTPWTMDLNWKINFLTKRPNIIKKELTNISTSTRTKSMSFENHITMPKKKNQHTIDPVT